jgi:hypothetical protein
MHGFHLGTSKPITISDILGQAQRSLIMLLLLLLRTFATNQVRSVKLEARDIQIKRRMLCPSDLSA